MALAWPLCLLLAWWAGRNKPAFAAHDWSAIAGLGFCGYYLASLLGNTEVHFSARQHVLNLVLQVQCDLATQCSVQDSLFGKGT